MSRVTKTIVLPLLLISVICAGSVEGFYYWFGLYVEKVRDSASRGTGEEAPAMPASGNIAGTEHGSDGYAAIIERNLFASRVNIEDTGWLRDPLEGVEASTLDVVLMGTVLGNDDGGRAIIYDKGEKKQELYQVGDYIQQAMIKQILRGKVILNYNGRDEMLDISEARNVAMPAVTAAPSVVVRHKMTGRPVERQLLSPVGVAAESGEPANGNNANSDRSTGEGPIIQ